MINLFKLLRFWKPDAQSTDLTQSESEIYEDEIEVLRWDIKCLRGIADAQIIEISKLKGHCLRISLEADAQAAENNNLRLELAKKVTPKKRNKK